MSENKLPVKTVSNLAKLLKDRNLEEKAIAGLEECLDAKITMKNEDGKIIEYTDYRTILGAIQTVLNYTAGKPIERREVITRHATTLEELQKQAKGSPEFRRVLRELLDEKPVGQAPKATESSATE